MNDPENLASGGTLWTQLSRDGVHIYIHTHFYSACVNRKSFG